MAQISEEQIFADWLSSSNRQVKISSGSTSAFISCHISSSLGNVWDAWTDLEKISQWLACVSGNMQEGKEIILDVGAPDNITVKIITLEPLQRLRFTWFYPGRVIDEIEVRFSPDGDATALELEQYSTDKSNWWYGAGSGWESALVRLELFLSGSNPKAVSNEKFDQIFGPLWLNAGNQE